MAVDLADLLKNRRTITAKDPFSDFEVTVVYAPAVYTVGLAEVVFSTPYVELIPKLVIEWDLEADGQPLPITPDGVVQLPTRLSKEIVLAIVKDNNQGEAGSS